MRSPGRAFGTDTNDSFANYISRLVKPRPEILSTDGKLIGPAGLRRPLDRVTTPDQLSVRCPIGPSGRSGAVTAHFGVGEHVIDRGEIVRTQSHLGAAHRYAPDRRCANRRRGRCPPCAATRRSRAGEGDPFAEATLPNAETIDSLWARFSPEAREHRPVPRSCPRTAPSPVPVCGDADAEVAAGGSIPLDSMERVSREYSICRSLIGATAAARRIVSADFAQADRPDISGLDELRDRSHGFFDRNVRVEPCRPIDVDMVGAQAARE